MSTDKDPLRSTHETLALIADKLAVERRTNSDVAAPETPTTPIVVPEPPPAAAAPQPEMPAAAAPPEPTPSGAPISSPPPAAAAPAPVPAAESVAIAPLKNMWQRQPVRDAVLTYFPMAIAVMSLGLSIYQGFLFHESIDIMQRNVARGEYIRTCRDIIETYFQVKQRVGVLMPVADRGNVAGASRVTEVNRLDAQAAIAKFGGLGTYLANFQDPGTRARYTELTRTLAGIMDTARTTQLTEIDKLFAPADKLFSQMNDDCARQSRAMRM
jgi:hypothetical protein